MATLTIRPPFPPPGAPPASTPAISVDDPGRAAPQDRPMSASLRAFVVIVTALLAAMLIALGLRARGTLASHRYQTETAVSGQVTGMLAVPAHLIPTASLRIGTEETGRVASVAVRPGDRVSRGQVLARIEDRKLRALAAGAEASAVAAEVNAQQAQLRLAQIMYLLRESAGGLDGAEVPRGSGNTRNELQGAALEAEVDLVNAAAELKKQTAAASATRTSMSHAVLRSPIDGVVMSRSVEPGETVPAGAPLFIVASDPSEMELLATIDEADIPFVAAPGAAVFSVPAYPGRQFQAVITAVEPASEPAGRFSYRLRLRATNTELALRPGMTATVQLPLASHPDALLVPASAVAFTPAGTAPESGAAVYVRGGAGAHRVPVKVGVTDGRMAEVRGTPLQPGTPVIVGERR
jgi:HlyD family secretion protein